MPFRIAIPFNGLFLVEEVFFVSENLDNNTDSREARG